MKNRFLWIFPVLLLMLSACTGGSDYTVQVQSDLDNKIEVLKGGEPLSGAFALAEELQNELSGRTNKYNLTSDEIESLKFLYAYMPVNDMAENSFEYFVNIVRYAHKTKDMPWGESVSDDLFRHFVLPPRVNNETLDNAREIFYNELYPRVKDLSMYDAVIEINHWCREKIVYTPTDGRTTPPAQTALRAYGRCGEESTVAVAALRSMGIPARQVYVPRWAHTNSNHAWVEVWVDGTWYYLGACEPEPLLDRGWFTASASRAMLVNTYAYGPVVPSEDTQIKGEIISQSDLFTEISSTATYAPVKKAVVKVVDTGSKPVEGAAVSFNIINGNSLSPMVERITDEKGIAYLTTGLGTFIIEVYFKDANGNEFYKAEELRVPDTDELVVVLDGDQRKGNGKDKFAIADYRVTPPAETRFPKALSEEMQKEHDAKCAEDDSIRLAHTATFKFNSEEKASAFSKSMVDKGMSSKFEKDLTNLMMQTLSGGENVENFLLSVDGSNLNLAVQLLKVIRVKDIQEITTAGFQDYLNGVLKLGSVYDADNPMFVQTVLNPRFSNELPVAFKEKLWNELVACGMSEPGANVQTLDAINKALDKVVIVDDSRFNPRNFYMTPASIAEFGMADSRNYAVYARALFNTAGIPARMNNQTQEIQYLSGGKWEIFPLKISKPLPASQSEANAVLRISDPEGKAAGRRYLLQKWQGDSYGFAGGFGMGRGTQRQGDSDVSVMNVEPGYYRILTSIRAADGSMLARTMTFTVEPNTTTDITVEWYPVEKDELVVIGSMDAEWRYSDKDSNPSDEVTSILNTVGRNFFVLAFIEPTKEPSQHFIRELTSKDDDIAIPILIMFNDKEKTDFFFKQNYGLNDKINYGFDSQNVVLKGLERSLATTDLQARLPVVVVADSFGNIYYQSVGYNIGVPETISKLNLPIHK
ncbi:MAG: transglutaminase domain-containing protein [Bacteroidales bacterium]|nr:transglutaminase domain-containing protein [Bacteroidales bacterium]MBR2477806.1 transglutaminase domain-containing protein [Bacteroidales bacterium]